MQENGIATVRVSTDDVLRRQIGSAITFDLVDFQQVGLGLSRLGVENHVSKCRRAHAGNQIRNSTQQKLHADFAYPRAICRMAGGRQASGTEDLHSCSVQAAICH